MAAGVHDVWARTAWAAVDLSHELGVTPDSLLVDLPFDAAALRRLKRVTWSDYCAIVERVAEAAGGMTEVEDLLADAYHTVTPELRSMTGALVNPRTLLRFVLDVLLPLLFPPIEVTWEDLADDRVRVSFHLRPGARPCEAWFRGTVGALRGVPAHLDLPMAEVTTRELAADRLVCDVRLPASRTLLRRARGYATRLILGIDRDGLEVTATIGAPEGDATERRLERATAVWQLTPRQAEVLARVVAGLANKEIAHELGCADNTVELHVTRVLRKAGVTSRTQLIAAFWSARWGFPQ